MADLMQTTMRIRTTAANVRLLASKLRMAQRAVEAATKGPIGQKKSAQLAQAAAAALGASAWYVQMISVMQDSEHMEQALKDAKEQAKMSSESIARRVIWEKFGTQIQEIEATWDTYVEMRDTCRELYPEITDLLKQVKLL